MDASATLRDRTCLVTGATSGIGKAIAQGLARRGATVAIVARDRARGEAAAAEIGAQASNAHVDLLLADLSSQAAIRALAEEVKQRYDRLHVLVNNAAVFKSRRELTPDGLEMMFATNHLAYYLLTHLLREKLVASAPAAVLSVTAPSTVRLNFDDLQGERSFSAPNAFGASKTCNLLFTFALARRAQGSGVSAHAYHPGLVRTNLMRQAPAPMRLLGGIFNLFGAVSAERAVAGLIRLAETAGGGHNGLLYHVDRPMDAPPYTRDEAVQERLWAESVRLTRLSM